MTLMVLDGGVVAIATALFNTIVEGVAGVEANEDVIAIAAVGPKRPYPAGEVK